MESANTNYIYDTTSEVASQQSWVVKIRSQLIFFLIRVNLAETKKHVAHRHPWRKEEHSRARKHVGPTEKDLWSWNWWRNECCELHRGSKCTAQHTNQTHDTLRMQHQAFRIAMALARMLPTLESMAQRLHLSTHQGGWRDRHIVSVLSVKPHYQGQRSTQVWFLCEPYSANFDVCIYRVYAYLSPVAWTFMRV